MGTVKASVLKGDDEYPYLYSTFIYYTNTVHFLSVEFQEVNWLMNKNIVWYKVN